MRRLAAVAFMIVPALLVAQEPVGTPTERLASTEPVTLDENGDVRPPYGKRLWLDLKALAAKPAHMESRDWKNLGLSVLVMGGVAALDDEIRELVQRNRSGGSDDVAETIRPLGHRVGPALIIAGCWAAGRIWDDPKLVAIAEDGLEATLFSVVLITPALKLAVGRAKPVEELGPWELRPFSEYRSFTSGEATQAFTLAAVVSAHSEKRWVDGMAWGLATLIGWERLALDRHWASDVVAGALIGAAVGRWVVHRREQPPVGDFAWSIAPSLSRHSVAVAGYLSF